MQTVFSILQGFRHAKSVDGSGEREDKAVKMITGLLAIIVGALVFNSALAVPRYSASAPQVGDSHHSGAYGGEVNPSVQTQPSYDALVQQAKDCFSNGRCATPQSAVLTGASQLYSDMECKGKIEGSYGVYYSKERGGYYFDQHDMSYGKHDVRPEYRDCNPKNCSPDTQPRFNDKGDPLVAHVHNHPVENGQESAWPSVADVKGAITGGIDEYVVACSMDIAKTPIKVLRVDCRTGRVYLLSWPGSEEEFERPSQFNEAYDAQKIKSIDQLSDDDCYDPERFEELRDFVRGKNISGAKRSAVTERNTVSNRMDVANSTSSAAPDSDVGVRGWCDCGADHGKICFMGEGAYSSDGTNIGGGDYIYRLCGKCAKLFKPSRLRDEAEIIDLRIERKYKKFVGTERMPTHKYLSLLKQAENKLLDIPDGEIVIHGVCTCKEPDPIVFSYASYAYVKAGKQNLAVCCSCGKEYVSADGSIPCGPTAKREMGLE